MVGERRDESGRTQDMSEPDGWARNERERRVIGLDATPAERLAWLEEAIALAYRTGALPKSTD
jgi:hypothetical protein